MGEREVRVQSVLDRFVSGVWLIANREIVPVESKAWMIVRRADDPQAAPFIISRKEWNKLPLRSPSPSEGE